MPGTTANLAAGQPLIPSAASPQFPAAYPLSFDQMIMQGNASGVTFTPPTNYYPMNEASGTTVVDAMGVANGTYHGTLLYQQKLLIPDGKPGPYFKATVGFGYATLADPTTSNTSFSIMFGFTPYAYENANALISNFNGNSTAGNYIGAFWGAPGLLNQSYASTSTQITAPLGSGCSRLGFLVFDGSNYRWYLDSSLLLTQAGSYTKQAAGWGIGANPNGTQLADLFPGKVGLWGSTALTQAQITAITLQFQNAGAVTAIVNPYNNFDTIVTQALAGAPAPTNYYPMNEASGTTVVDAMGNANGTYQGTLLYQQKQLIPDGKPVPYFNYSNSNYATLNDPTASSTAFSIMVAFSVSAQKGTNSNILSNYNGNTSAFQSFGYINSVGGLIGDVNNSNRFAANQSPPSAVHLGILTYDGTSFRHYLDGALVATTASSYTKQAAGWGLGAHANAAAGSFFDGCIGKAGIWGSTALTQQQITNLTNAFFAPQGSQLNQNLQGATSTYPIGSVITAQPVKLVSGSTVTITLPTLPTGNWSLLAQAFWDAGAGTGTITGTGATWDFSGTVSYGNGTLSQTVGQLAGTAVGGQTPSSSYSNSVALSSVTGYYLTLVATRTS